MTSVAYMRNKTMPPQRIRNVLDDSRSGSSSTRERYLGSGPSGVAKPRRNGSTLLPGSALKDVTNVHSSLEQQGNSDTPTSVRDLLRDTVIEYPLMRNGSDQLVVIRLRGPPRLQAYPPPRHSTGLQLPIQPKHALNARYRTALANHGTT